MKIQQTLISTCLAIGSVALVGGVRSLANAAIAPENGIWLYTEAQCTGASFVLPPDQDYALTLRPEQRNQISSLRVPPGFEVTLIDREGRQAQSRTFGAGEHRLLDERINNKADAVIVTRN